MAISKPPVHVGGGSATTTFALGATAAAGNLLVAFATNSTATPNNVPAGWTDLGSASASGGTARSCRMVYKVSDGTETGITFSANGSGWIAEYSGVDQTTPNIGGTANCQVTAAGTSHATLSITPTAGKSAIVICGLAVRGNPTWSAEAVSGSNVGTVTEERDVGQALADALITSTTGAYSGSGTSSLNLTGMTGIAIFQEAGAAAPKSLVFEPRRVVRNSLLRR